MTTERLLSQGQNPGIEASVKPSLAQLKAVVVELVGDRAVLELEDGRRREVSAPAEIQITVGMAVRMIDTGDDAPIIAWGV